MTEKSKNILRLVYYVLITAALVTVAILLMVACVSIYRMGEHPFSRELVAYHFDRIAIPVYVCLGLVVIGFVLHPLLPPAPETDTDRDRVVARRLAERTDLALCPAELAADIRKQRVLRNRHRAIVLGLLAVGVVVFLGYALSFERLSMEDINGSMVHAMWVLIPCVGLPGAYGIFSLYDNRASYRREIALYRQAPKEAKVAAPAVSGKKPWERVLRQALLVFAIGLIIGGWAAGGWVDVLTKAINICTECVGLG